MNRERKNGKMIKTRSAPARARLKLFKNKWQLYLLLIPALIYIGIFAYAPMYGIQIAFKNYRTDLGIWGSPWVGLKNILKFFNSVRFTTIVGNTLRLSLYSLIAGFPLPVIFALMLGVMLVLTIPALVREKLHRWQGVVLLSAYAAYCVFLFCFA